MAIKFCVKCGTKFNATGREIICPSCKAAAAEETKRAAVLRAKQASWTGESVPVRISGRASTVIRKYGTDNNLPFAQALDELLKSTYFFQNDEIPTKKHLLNGADNWKEYSYGGCSFVYNADICLRLCTPSTIKKTKNGMRNPNGKENWLDVQTRALYQASHIILKLAGMER